MSRSNILLSEFQTRHIQDTPKLILDSLGFSSAATHGYLNSYAIFEHHTFPNSVLTTTITELSLHLSSYELCCNNRSSPCRGSASGFEFAERLWIVLGIFELRVVPFGNFRGRCFYNVNYIFRAKVCLPVSKIGYYTFNSKVLRISQSLLDASFNFDFRLGHDRYIHVTLATRH